MSDKNRTKPDLSYLYETAGGQLGHFTTAQAHDCGFSSSLVTHHVHTGKFIRIHRGVYRLRDYPSWPREEVMAAWLAVGRERSVVSHESALDLLNLSDVIPHRIHLTVPRSVRNLPKLPGIVIHTTTRPLRPEDVINIDGMRVTAPVRTILDAAEWGTAGEQVEMAIREATARGLTTERRLKRDAASRSGRIQQLVDWSLVEAA